MERANDRRTADLASQPFMLLPFYKHERCRRELGECGRRRQHRRLPRSGVKGGTVSPFHALHGTGISTVLSSPQLATMRLVIIYL